MSINKIKQKYNDMSRLSALSWLLGLFLTIGGLYLMVMVKSKIATISYALSPPELPPYKPAKQREDPQLLKQNWSPEQSQWFHYASQGTATLPIPYKWLIALEQPASSPWSMLFSHEGRFIDDDYILRMGFVKGEVAANNPDGLPIGFAQTDSYYFAGLDRKATAIGFTCAACHTSHLIYNDTEYVIEGGPATTDLSLLTGSLGVALGQTALSSKLQVFNGRFDRFAERVLGEQFNVLTRATLKEQLNATLEQLVKSKDVIDTTEGFTRLDALNRIGNQVFSADLARRSNYHVINAPVNYPHIWTSSWFDWVQYDASIMQPLVRNAGEALGVKAYVNTTAPSNGERFASSIPYNQLFKIEKLLAGDNPLINKTFGGLLAPTWPASMPAIDQSKRDRGEALYDKHCKGCHLPPINSAEIWNDPYLQPISYSVNGVQIKTEESYLKLNIIPLEEIGTDPMQASVLVNRTVDTTSVGLDTEICTNSPLKPRGIYGESDRESSDAQYSQSRLTNVPFKDTSTANFGLALGAFVQMTNEQWMQQNYIPKDWWSLYNGNRPNCLQVGVGYKARPLNGIWATAPFLHNGSIPTIYDLLSPLVERPTFVELGSQIFDTKKVGILQTEKFIADTADYKNKDLNSTPEYKNGLFILDTRKKGNWNNGHQFETGYVRRGNNPKGVIGSFLNHDQREELVEYLKTL